MLKPLPDHPELERLLSLVVYQPRLNYLEGLQPFQTLMPRDDGRIVQFLEEEWPRLEGKKRGGVAFLLAHRYRETGDVEGLRRLFDTDDPEVKRYVLNALWDTPGGQAEVAACIVDLALEGAGHPAPEVRTEASFVFMNQAGHKTDVSRAVEPLHGLLRDPDPNVRRQAAYAVGHLGKQKYSLPTAIPLLRDNLEHPERQVRESAAWALWHLSRKKHDIGEAVEALVGLLKEPEDVGDLMKNAAGALLHHAGKSPENEERVREAVRAALPLTPEAKSPARLLEQLGLSATSS